MIPLLVALILQAPQRDTRPVPAAAPTGSIVGRVVSADAQPRPLRRARVTIGGSSLANPRTTISADDGTFVFERVPAGRFTATAAKDGYVPMNYGATRSGRPGAAIAVVEGQSSRVELRLPRGAVITGTVTDIDGQPAAGILMNVLSRRFAATGPTDYRYAAAGALVTVTTDDRGIYRVYGLPAGEYIVGAQPMTSPFSRPGTEVNLVRLMSRDGSSTKEMLLSQVFHPSGTDPTRAARVSVRAGEERSGVDVQLEYVPLATVSGTANLPAGFGPARVTLWRLDELSQPQSGPVVTADPQGRFDFRRVAPGHFRVTARGTPPGEASNTRVSPAVNVQYATADITVNGEDVEVALATQAALSIAGRVLFETDGAPVPALPVQLRLNIPTIGLNGGWPLPPLVIDGARFRLDGVVPGAYRPFRDLQGIRSPIGRWWMKSIIAGGRDLLDVPIDLQQSIDDAVVTLSDRASELSGAVTDAQGVPALDSYVIVFSTDRGTWFANSRRVVGLRPDRDGRYAVRNLPPGEYRAALATDLEAGEWFDPAVLETLLPTATPLTITGVEKTTLNLRQRPGG